jgi:hypothetical protein
MKYIAVLMFVLMLSGCNQEKGTIKQDHERFGEYGIYVLTDKVSGCKYVMYVSKNIIPLYKNSTEIECDRGDAE